MDELWAQLHRPGQHASRLHFPEDECCGRAANVDSQCRRVGSHLVDAAADMRRRLDEQQVRKRGQQLARCCNARDAGAYHDHAVDGRVVRALRHAREVKFPARRDETHALLGFQCIEYLCFHTFLAFELEGSEQSVDARIDSCVAKQPHQRKSPGPALACSFATARASQAKLMQSSQLLLVRRDGPYGVETVRWPIRILVETYSMGRNSPYLPRIYGRTVPYPAKLGTGKNLRQTAPRESKPQWLIASFRDLALSAGGMRLGLAWKQEKGDQAGLIKHPRDAWRH